MRIDLAAEMEYFSPEDRLSLQRILFYGRGGFDAIDPRHFPYRQPDFRDPKEIAATGDRPVPFMLLLRRVGREREARLPIDEAQGRDAAALRRLRDLLRAERTSRAASTWCSAGSRSGARRARTTSRCCRCRPARSDLRRLKPLFRYDVYRRHYGPGPATDAVLNGEIARAVAANPHWLDEQLAKLAEQLGARRSAGCTRAATRASIPRRPSRHPFPPPEVRA